MKTQNKQKSSNNGLGFLALYFGFPCVPLMSPINTASSYEK